MSGQGKYTKFAPQRAPSPFKAGTSNADPKYGRANDSILNRCFKQPDIIPASNSPEDLESTILKSANELLLPVVQDSYPEWFPNGKVYMDFNISNPDPELSAPDLPNVDVTQGEYAAAGGVTNVYTPNLKSPDPSGAGSIAPVVPVQISPEELQPGIVPGGTPGTLSPAREAEAIYSGNLLPSKLAPGKAPNRT